MHLWHGSCKEVHRMSEERVQEIEAEVVEIDDVAVLDAENETPEFDGERWRDMRHWRGQVRRLDMRWWPLWVLLGVLVFALLATVGLVLGVVYLLVRTVFRIVGGFLRMFAPPRASG